MCENTDLDLYTGDCRRVRLTGEAVIARLRISC